MATRHIHEKSALYDVTKGLFKVMGCCRVETTYKQRKSLQEATNKGLNVFFF